MMHFSRRAAPQYTNLVVTVARNESTSILEWIDYHIWLGFNKFAIYNQDDDPAQLESKLRSYVLDDVVSLIRASPGEQKSCYTHAIHNFATAVSTLTFLDVDEYVVLCDHANANDACSSYLL